MALSQAAAMVEKVLGHNDNAVTEQDITNPGRDRAKYADPSGETMKALCWMGKNTVKLSKSSISTINGGCTEVHNFNVWDERRYRTGLIP
jgi:hypothetical protein